MKLLILLTLLLATGCATDFDTYFYQENINCSPKDRIAQKQIHVYDDRIIINITGSEWAEFDDTNSMLPTFDKGHNNIEYVPKNESEIQICDIVSYTYKDFIVVHRVTEIGTDENGWYAVLKGDNNPIEDPDKVRFNQIKGVVIGILY